MSERLTKSSRNGFNGVVTDPLDDRGLAAALRTGDPQRLRAAFDRHIIAMTLLARSLSGGGDTTVDQLVATIWTSVTADFDRDQPRGSARAWLFARLAMLDPTAGAAALDEGPDGPRFLPADDPWEGHWVDFPAAWRAAPDAWETSAAGRAAVVDGIAALPLVQRVVLVLRDLDGWTPAEVGALTGLPPDEERAVLSAARMKIRNVLDLALRVGPAEPAADQATGAGQSASPPSQEPTALAESPDLTCQVSVALVPKYLDDNLPEGQTVRLEQHIAICPGCSTYLGQLRRTIAAVARLQVSAPRDQLWAGIAARLPAVAPADAGPHAIRHPALPNPRPVPAGPGDTNRVLAYKFLASDRTARFSQVRWPWPAKAGEWVSAAAVTGTCRPAVHACRAKDLAFWLDQGLWRVELAGEVTESGTKIVAQRGRLLEPVDRWPEVVPAFMDDCAARLGELQRWAKEKRDHRASRMLRDYMNEVADATDPASVSYTVAHSAEVVGWLPGEGMAAKARGERSPFDAERRRQGRWLADRLGLVD